MGALAISAYTYSIELTAAGMLFGKLDAYLEETLPEWLYKPLIGCAKCVSGQLSFWGYFYFCNYIGFTYNLPIHLITVLCTIFFTVIIVEVYKKF